MGFWRVRCDRWRDVIGGEEANVISDSMLGEARRGKWGMGIWGREGRFVK